jgi:hypothetical protein
VHSPVVLHGMVHDHRDGLYINLSLCPAGNIQWFCSVLSITGHLGLNSGNNKGDCDDSYGIMFWGNSPHSRSIFVIQERIVRIIMKAKARDSCREMFSVVASFEFSCGLPPSRSFLVFRYLCKLSC